MPVERPPRSRERIHRVVRFGRHADLFLLDGRTHRVDGETLLGAEQTEWLTEGLAGSRASWKLLGNPVPLMNLDSPGSPDITGVNGGSWAAFPQERAELAATLRRRGVDDVVALTGDAHAFYAGQVTDTGRSDGRPFATEFVAGTLAATNAATSVFENARPVSSPGLGGIDRSSNPHLAFSDPARHGFAVVEATERELDVTYHAADTIYRPQSASTRLASFRVPRGRPEISVEPA